MRSSEWLALSLCAGVAASSPGVSDSASPIAVELAIIGDSLSLANLVAVDGMEPFAVAVLYIFWTLILLSTFLFVYWTLRTPIDKRLCFYLALASNVAGLVAWLALATDYGTLTLRRWLDDWQVNDLSLSSRGSSEYPNQFYDDAYASAPVYVVFEARYVDWLFSVPIVVYQLCLLAGAPLDRKVLVMGVAQGMVLCFLLCAVVLSTVRFAFWFFGCVFLAVLVYLLRSMRSWAAASGETRGRLFQRLARILILSWLLSSVLMIFSEGLRLLPPSVVACAIVALDFPLKIACSFFLLRARPIAETCGSEASDAADSLWKSGADAQHARHDLDDVPKNRERRALEKAEEEEGGHDDGMGVGVGDVDAAVAEREDE